MTDVLIKGNLDTDGPNTQGEFHVKIGIMLLQGKELCTQGQKSSLEQILPSTLRAHGPANTSISDFWPPELGKSIFCCFEPPVCGTLSCSPQDTNTQALVWTKDLVFVEWMKELSKGACWPVVGTKGRYQDDFFLCAGRLM